MIQSALRQHKFTHEGLRIRGSESEIPPLRLNPLEARQIDGLSRFVKTTVAPQRRTSDPRDSDHEPGRDRKDVDRGYGFFSQCIGDTPLCTNPVVLGKT